MKRMKRIVTGLLAIGLVLSMAACGKEQTVVMQYEYSEAGISMTDTTTLTAKGDVLQSSKEVIEIDISSFDDETKEQVIALYDAAYSSYEGIDAITVNSSTTDTTYTTTIVFDYTGDTTALEEAGFIEGGNAHISLKQTQQSLEAEGYKVVE